MAAPITDNDQRKYPLNQPDGWKPKIPRVTLRLPDEVEELAIANIGIQAHSGRTVSKEAATKIDEWSTSGPDKPLITEKFTVLFGRDQPESLVYACYWTSKSAAENALKNLDLSKILQELSSEEKQHTGLWFELFTPDLTRFETNYSGTDYQPGLAQLPKTKQVPHNLTGYWGAARDRIRASAYEHLDDSDSADGKGSSGSDSSSEASPPSTPAALPPDFKKATLSKHLRGTNKRTLAHIRSGQFWENCSEEESEAYEDKLHQHLVNGLHDILDHPVEKGDHGLRFLRNIPVKPQSYTRKETCGIGFFRTLHDLEDWAKNCPSHHKIFGGLLSHKNRFGDGMMMRTWHEVSVLRPGEAKWEYFNCDSGTGILPFVESEVIGEVNS